MKKILNILIILVLTFTACSRSKAVMFETVSPNIFVNDINETIRFYKQIGFTLQQTVPGDEPYDFAMMNSGGVTFMFQTFKSLGNELPDIQRENGSSLLLYVKVKNIGDLYGKIKGKAVVLKFPEKTFYGTTEFSIRDNNGYVITFSEDIE